MATKHDCERGHATRAAKALARDFGKRWLAAAEDVREAQLAELLGIVSEHGASVALAALRRDEAALARFLRRYGLEVKP